MVISRAGKAGKAAQIKTGEFTAIYKRKYPI